MTPFLVVGCVGLLLLIASIVVGDLLDLVGLGDGLVSGVALGAALSVLGLAGIVTTQADLPPWATWLVAVLLAAVVLFLVQLLVRRLTRRESGGHWSPVGLVGVVTSDTTPTGGEVALEGERELERRLAVSSERLPRGTRVRVVAEREFRVEVERDGGGPGDGGDPTGDPGPTAARPALD